jgi:hypothetical protein
VAGIKHGLANSIAQTQDRLYVPRCVTWKLFGSVYCLSSGVTIHTAWLLRIMPCTAPLTLLLVFLPFLRWLAGECHHG